MNDREDDEEEDELVDEELDELDDDLDDDGVAREPRRHPAIFAPNWRTVLVVDGSIGVAILLVGIVLAVAWNPFVGGFIGSIGFVYVALVVRRGQDWARQRRAAGLD